MTECTHIENDEDCTYLSSVVDLDVDGQHIHSPVWVCKLCGEETNKEVTSDDENDFNI